MIIYALFATVLVLAAWRVDARLWGVHHLAFLAPAYTWGAVLALLALLHPGLAGRVARVVSTIGSRGVGSHGVALGAGVGVLILCFLNRIEFYFLGDGLAWANGLDAGNVFHFFEPLALALTRAVGSTAAPENLVSRAATLSVGLGAAYVYGAARVCASLWNEPGARGVGWLLLVVHPLLLLFCGYLESYPILIVVQTYYLWALLASARGRCALAVPVAAGAVAVATHVSALPWLLGLVVVADARAAAQQASTQRATVLPVRERLRSGQHVARVVVAPAAAMLLAALIVWGVGGHPGRLVANIAGDAGLGGHSWTWMFSWRHVVDVANEMALLLGPALLLVAPTLMRAPALGVWAPSVERHIVLSMVAGPLVIALVVEPRIGGARDWDLFAPLAMPATLLCVDVWRRLSPAAARSSAGRAVGFALVVTLAWLAVGTSSERSAQRFETWQQPNALLSNFARGYMNETLGIYHRDGDIVAARNAWQRAAAANPNNPRYFNNLGNAAARMNDHEGACAAYRRALDLGMQRYHLTFNVAGCASRGGEYARADSLLSVLVRLEPERSEAWSERGFVRLRLGRPQEALDDLREALEHDARDAETWYRTGLAHAELGDTEGARTAWRKTLEIQPRHAGARRRLDALN